MLRHDRQHGRDVIGSQPGMERRRAKLPSGSGLPPCWTDDMDKAICHMEAADEAKGQLMVKALKGAYPDLQYYPITYEILERRIATLEFRGNNGFRTGLEVLTAKVGRKGHELPPFDPTGSKYPIREYPRKSDLEVYGSGSPMTGDLAFGASNAPTSEITAGVSKMSINAKYKTTGSKATGGTTPADQTNQRNNDLQVETGESSAHPHQSTDVGNTPANPRDSFAGANYGETLYSVSCIGGPTVRPVSSGPPSTPINTYPTQPPGTPANNTKRTPSRDRQATPSTKLSQSSPSGRNRHAAFVGKENFSTPTGSNFHRTPSENRVNVASGSMTRGSSEGSSKGKTDYSSASIYRSGRDVAPSDLSNTTANTSILGREVSGMSAALQRRHAKVDNRQTPDD